MEVAECMAYNLEVNQLQCFVVITEAATPALKAERRKDDSV